MEEIHYVNAFSEYRMDLVANFIRMAFLASTVGDIVTLSVSLSIQHTDCVMLAQNIIAYLSSPSTFIIFVLLH